MRDEKALRSELRRIEGRPYPAYRDLKGPWSLEGGAVLFVDHVQGDPYAAPSSLRLTLPSALEPHSRSRSVRIATEDWLLRRLVSGLRGASRRRGSGKSGQLEVLVPGPEVVERSALRLHQDGTLEIRLRLGLPARGRRIAASECTKALFDDLLPAASALQVSSETPELLEHLRGVQRQRGLRAQLEARGLIAFIADGSVLPRATGVSSGPLDGALPFEAPEGPLAVELDTADGPVRGLGVPRGVTVIVGGGFHGKSTVLQALQWGHLDFIAGDGREQVVTHPDTVKVRAEDGRAVHRVDISTFLRNLPGGLDTRTFSTQDASGSTSQASGIIEACEAGAKVLLLDEDTSATNLLVRDLRMRELIDDADEPITPFVQRIRAMYEQWGVSTVMVVGGVSDYLDVADQVLAMRSWRCHDSTEAARALRRPTTAPPHPLQSKPPSRSIGDLGIEGRKIRARDTRALQIDHSELELSAVEQVRDPRHAATLGQCLRFIQEELLRKPTSVGALVQALEAVLDDEGLDTLSPREHPVGDLVATRRHEVAAALNRLRSLSET